MSFPSRAAIKEQFQHMADGDYEAFFKKVSPDVDWTVMGTHPCAGRYHSLQDFQEATLKRLGAIMQAPGMKLALRNVIGGGDQPWATAELVTNAVCKNDFHFDNCYAWVVRYNEQGIIVEVRAYLDSWMVNQAIVENEDKDAKSNRAPVPRVGDL
ncbi:hypothetical protein AMS68_006861 [Peltaster fructicola]|uniref:SnoaL-like domain-containing protein n=1 Tax=Peltaster fructicola TaxID=286661 RepID=A0A6H0Y2V6_9PEZI|nr:hypothetical protein AMS68_006861 [Peltaster fructicola]